MKIIAIPLLFLVLLLTSCKDNDTSSDFGTNSEDPDRIPAAPLISYSIVNAYPHDTASFTEGLTFYNGQLYESTGSPEEPENSGSWIGAIDITTGKSQKKINQGSSLFGEGITFLHDKVYQLTYRSEIGFVYDAKTFKKLRQFSYKGEGWGLTNDGVSLIMSAGTSNLYYLQPDSLKFTRMIAIQDNNGYVNNINELEYIDGFIYANKWLSGELLKIDPATARVVGRMDFSKLVAEVKSKYPEAAEMNGIAYDSATKKMFITGKKWPLLYEIRF